MINTEIDADKLFLLWKKQNEVTCRVAEGSLALDAALVGIQSILDGLYSVKIDCFARYVHLLCPLSQQALKLRELNKKMSGPVPDSWFDNLNVTSKHIQSVEDLEFFVVITGTLEETFRYQLELIKLTQPVMFHSGFEMDERNMRLDPSANSELFKTPGVKKLRINLVDNWSPKIGRSINQVRMDALASDKNLAGLLAIGAYALQDPELYQSQDGENLPYFEMADIQQGSNFNCAPHSAWSCEDREVCFSSYDSDFTVRDYAIPSLV